MVAFGTVSLFCHLYGVEAKLGLQVRTLVLRVANDSPNFARSFGYSIATEWLPRDGR